MPTDLKVRSLSWESLERGAGVTRADMLRFAEMYGKAGSAITVWSMGITQHAYRSQGAVAIVGESGTRVWRDTGGHASFCRDVRKSRFRDNCLEHGDHATCLPISRCGRYRGRVWNEGLA